LEVIKSGKRRIFVEEEKVNVSEVSVGWDGERETWEWGE
jgi:hypothetical protein